jgi:hypothetical protein
MLWYAAAISPSKKSVRLVWLILLSLGNWLAALVYYAFSYLKQSRHQSPRVAQA